MNLQGNDSCFGTCCYRIGKKEYDTNKPMMVRFSTNLPKKLVDNNERYLKNTRIVIREDLPKEQLGIVKESSEKVCTGQTQEPFSMF
ncbi:hypothetical protein JTB14_006940 [Gonioctena quinquepunctata]|nr:hypothetical protein JTB14_006940 [Gonioctena quinquepunctata]